MDTNKNLIMYRKVLHRNASMHHKCDATLTAGEWVSYAKECWGHAADAIGDKELGHLADLVFGGEKS